MEGESYLCFVRSDAQGKLVYDERLEGWAKDSKIILSRELDQARPERVAQALLAELSRPFLLGGREHRIGASIGISLFPEDGTDMQELLTHADAAMYQAKDSGRNAIRFFDPNMQSHLEKRAAIEEDLRSAHDSRKQLIPYYQVQVDEQGKAIGVELLLRWPDSSGRSIGCRIQGWT